MIDYFAGWGCPQWAIAALLMLGLLVNGHLHGKPRTGTIDFRVALVRTVLIAFVLHVGGFW